MRHLYLIRFVLVLMLLMASAFISTAQDDNADGDGMSAMIEDAAAGNTAFAFDLYQAVRGTDGNLFFSPYSVSQALAMTYAGAEGDTAAQMADTLRFQLEGDALHEAMSALNAEVTGREYDLPPAEEGEDADSRVFRLNVANALWGQQGFPFRADFINLLDETYNAGLRMVDYIQDTEGARQQINDWVTEQTEDRIQDIVPQGALDELTRLVLANAIYFNAGWAFTFEESMTSEQPFTLLDGSTQDVQMMQQTQRLRHAVTEDFSAVELPYVGGDFTMVAVLPPEGAFESFEANLDSERFEEIVGALQSGPEVQLAMPRFEFSTDLNLSSTLQDMGMTDAFEPNTANFEGMAELPQAQDLFISDVLHKAYVGVDESGTEAAAATTVIMGVTSAAPAEPIAIRLDRPFIFAIRDNVTGSVLFLGRVTNPAA